MAAPKKVESMGEIATILHEQSDGDGEWFESAWDQVQRWVARGDGVAVYENVDLGHPGLGHKQVVSFGSDKAMLSAPFFALVRDDGEILDVWLRRDQAESAQHSSLLTPCRIEEIEDHPPKRMPDIGTAINWRYWLHSYYRPVKS